MSAPAVRIGERLVGPGHPVYIVAEMSANHGGSLDRAKEIVRSAKEAGADAVKLQTYTADTMTIRCDNERFRIRGTIWEGRTLHDLYAEAHTPWEWQPELKRLGESLGLDVFSSPFDVSAVEFLERLGVRVYKIASFELVDLPLIETVARTGKPMILSTGMATLEEIRDAVGTARRAGAGGIILLKCTSAYPAPPGEMNLRTLQDLERTFDLPAGLSDHTKGTEASVAAVALGACVVERHLTVSRSLPTPDGEFSLEPAEFKGMTEAIRTVERALGEVRYGPSPAERPSLAFRRSLFAVEAVKAGELLTPKNVRAIRPSDGLAPKHLNTVLNRRAARNLPAGTPLQWGDLEGS